MADVQIGTVDVPASSLSVTSATTLQVASPLGSAEVGHGAGTGGSGSYTVSVTLRDGATSVPSAASRLALFAPTTSAAARPVVDGVGPSGGNEADATATVIYGSGLAAATAVTFGGVAGTIDRVVSDDELDVTAPAFASSTSCLAGDEPATDVCQSQVIVTTPNGTSAPGTILPEGSVPTGAGSAPPRTEVVPAATEFDYLPTPVITGLHESDGPPDLASEAGGSAVTITGRGLGLLGLMWIDVGPPLLASSDVPVVSESGTSATFILPAIAPTRTVASRRVSVQTEASTNVTDIAASAPSNVVRADYAPTPSVSTATTPNRRSDGPSTGGTTLTLRGHGFDGAEYVVLQGGFSTATDYDIDVVGDDRIVLTTPGSNPGIDHVRVCGVSGCSKRSAATFTYYPRGKPRLSSITPRTGRAGTRVRISGRNLGFVVAVYFGATKARVFANGSGYLVSGNADLVTAVAPPGHAGSTVDIRVVTLESESTGASPKSPVNRAVTFHYRR